MNYKSYSQQHGTLRNVLNNRKEIPRSSQLFALFAEFDVFLVDYYFFRYDCSSVLDDKCPQLFRYISIRFDCKLKPILRNVLKIRWNPLSILARFLKINAPSLTKNKKGMLNVFFLSWLCFVFSAVSVPCILWKMLMFSGLRFQVVHLTYAVLFFSILMLIVASVYYI